MVRQGKWKYIQYRHYLSAYKNYDPNEIHDVSGDNEDVVNKFQEILKNTYDHEKADCVAKKQDMDIFNEFIWKKYNQTQIYNFFKSTYDGFDDTDWKSVVEWRKELMHCQHGIK